MLSEYEQNLSKENDSETECCHSSNDDPHGHRKQKRLRQAEERGVKRRGKYTQWKEQWKHREITTIDENSV